MVVSAFELDFIDARNSYGSDRQFKQETVVEVCSSFLTTMSWSEWSIDTDGCESIVMLLALASC